MNINEQLTINILIQFSIVSLVGLSLSINYSTTRFFNLIQAAIIPLGSYTTYLFYSKFKSPLFIAIIISCLCCITLSALIEICVYTRMRANNIPPFALLVASIGIYTIIQNTLSLFFGDDAKTFSLGEIKVGREIGSAYITDIQIITVFACAGLFITTLLLLYNTTTGKKIRAVSDNSALCVVYGINSNRVILGATIVSTLLTAFAGILISLDLGMTPMFGFNYFLYGAVAMIAGGVGRYKGIVFGALLLASAQNIVAQFMDSKWMDTVAYVILILFLIWRPLGFSGQRLRKVEV